MNRVVMVMVYGSFIVGDVRYVWEMAKVSMITLVFGNGHHITLQHSMIMEVVEMYPPRGLWCSRSSDQSCISIRKEFLLLLVIIMAGKSWRII